MTGALAVGVQGTVARLQGATERHRHSGNGWEMAERTELQDGLDARPPCYGTSHSRYDVRFTKSGCTPTSCICVIVALMFVALGSAAGVYFGLHLLGLGRNNERIFKGKFLVTSGDNYTQQLEDVLSDEFQKKAYFYETLLDKLYNGSNISENFRQAEILAFNREKNGLQVHFNLHFMVDEDISLTSTDLYVVLIEDVRKKNSPIFKGLVVDYESIHVEERMLGDQSQTAWTLRRHYPGYLETPTTTEIASKDPDNRHCAAVRVDFCASLPYNQTSYPNLVGHKTLREVTDHLVAYRQIVDLECYSFAQNVVCQLLQPECKDSSVLLPCRYFCEEFLDACRTMLRQAIVESINCTNFPNPPDVCRHKMGVTNSHVKYQD